MYDTFLSVYISHRSMSPDIIQGTDATPKRLVAKGEIEKNREDRRQKGNGERPRRRI